MYHIGKVLKLIKASDKSVTSADNSVQAQLEMWDENQVIILVHPSLNDSIAVGNFVLARYSQPEPIIMKILNPKQAKDLWDEMKSFLSKKKAAVAEKMPFQMPIPNQGMEKMIR